MGKCEITNQSEYFLLDFSGQIDLQTVAEAFTKLLKNPEFSPTADAIWDFENSLIDMSISDLHKMADAVTASSDARSNQARAACVASDPSDRKTLENYITLTARYPVEFRLFDNRNSAVDWLNKS